MRRSQSISFQLIKSSLVLTDLLSVGLIFAFFVALRKILGGSFNYEQYVKLLPFLALFWLVFEKSGLYQGCAIYSGASIGPVEEMRRTFYAITAIFLGLGFANFAYRPNDYLYSRSILLCTYTCCLFIIPFNRFLLRKLFTRFNLWGVSTIIIGSGESASAIYQKLNTHPEFGLRPIGYFELNKTTTNHMPEDTRNLGSLDKVEKFSRRKDIKYAIIAEDTNSPDEICALTEKFGALFPHVLFIPRIFQNACAWVTSKDISGTLGLEIRHNLLIPSIYRGKRILDFLLTIPFLIVGSWIMLLIALLIKMDSKGPVIFKHPRITKNGKSMRIYKFRTMEVDAEEKLENLLKENSDMKQQWETFGKLDDDPRITRIGKWLRKTSLDELPQLFNVLQGKLTLVGPRPVIQEELKHYGNDADLFEKVLPGLTGLWQVSGRNTLSYEDRVRLDKYYVNNWSPWLDIYILSKTVNTVLFRRGAQ